MHPRGPGFTLSATMLKLTLLSLLLVAACGGAEAPVKFVVSIWKVGMVTTTASSAGTTTIGTQTTPPPRAESTTTGHHMDHQQMPVCTGAIVGEQYVLTTEECANATTNMMGIHISAGVGDLTVDNITSYFHVVSEVIRNPPFALLKVDEKFTQVAVKWRKSATEDSSTCSFTYWNTKIMRQHPFAKLQTIKCPNDQLGSRICAQKPGTESTTKLCDVGAEGAVLVCNEELAGMWGGSFGCQSFFFNEVQQKKDWLAENVHNGAAIAQSPTATFGILAVVFAAGFRRR